VYIKRKNNINESKKCRCISCEHCSMEEATHIDSFKWLYICREYKTEFESVLCCCEYYTGTITPSTTYNMKLFSCKQYKPIEENDDSLYNQYQLL